MDGDAIRDVIVLETTWVRFVVWLRAWLII